MSAKVRIFRNIKVLEVYNDYFIGARGYKLYKYFFASGNSEYLAKVDDPKYALFSKLFLTRRLLRAEITKHYTLPGGDRLVIAKKGIFRCPVGDTVYTKCFDVRRGSRPLNLCVTPGGEIYFGEYFANPEKQPVHIYHSGDRGKTWKTVYTFAAGTINHIHGIFWDPYTQRIWVATGDRENECIIAHTSDGFKTLQVLLCGGQKYRATNLFFYKDFVVYATDSQYIVNEIRKIDRQTLKIETLCPIQGSAIKGGQKGTFAYLSTTVEPSTVNRERNSHLWISSDGSNWKDIYKARKDLLPALFQFGSIEFPLYGDEIGHTLMFSGRALRKIGGCSVEIEL